jgi:hypothetical protein
MSDTTHKYPVKAITNPVTDDEGNWHQDYQIGEASVTQTVGWGNTIQYKCHTHGSHTCDHIEDGRDRMETHEAQDNTIRGYVIPCERCGKDIELRLIPTQQLLDSWRYDKPKICKTCKGSGVEVEK